MTNTLVNIDLNLAKSAVVEASAGTGKTYTLVRLALQLLLQEDAPLKPQELVLVTFTNDAAKELDIRLKELVKEQLLACSTISADYQKLYAIYQDLDRVTIATIHSFCTQILANYPFESALSFGNEIKPEQEDLLIKQFLRRYEVQLTSASKFEVQNFGNIMKLLKNQFNQLPELLAELLKSFRQVPDLTFLGADISEAFLVDLQAFADKKGELYELALEIQRAFSQNYAEIKALLNKQKMHPSTVKSLVKDFANAEKFASADGFLSLFFQKVSKDGKPSARLEVLLTYNFAEVPEFNRPLQILLLRLQQEFSAYNLIGGTTIATALLAINTLKTMIPQLEEFLHAKRLEFGIRNYDNLINDTTFLVNNNHTLLKTLQKQFKVAFIDEFQDTDLNQWSIFKKIFLEAKYQPHQLFLIGDPKQSIYAFRGGDLNVYQEAIQTIEDLTHNSYALTTNFRSRPALLAITNHIFSKLFQGDPGYQEIAAPEAPTAPVLLYRGQEGQNVVFLGSQTPGLKVDEYRDETAEAFCQQINQLLSDSNYQIAQLNAQKEVVMLRAVTPKDIVILVRNKKEGQLFKQTLEYNYQLPTYFPSNKMVVFASLECELLLNFLEVLSNPHQQSLLMALLISPLFNFNAADLDSSSKRYLEVKNHLLLWQELANKSLWGQIFGELLEVSGYFERALQPKTKSLSDAESRERSYANMHHLIELLVRQPVYGADAMFRELARLQQEDDNEILRLDRDDEALTILTAHGSKGLQYPIVFCCVGLPKKGESGSNGVKFFVDKVQKQLDLFKTEAIKERLEQHTIAEEKRLFYVAFTRAEAQIYLPQHTKKGSYFGLFMAEWQPELASDFKALQQIVDELGEPYLQQMELPSETKTGIVAKKSSALPAKELVLAQFQRQKSLTEELLAFSSYTSLWKLQSDFKTADYSIVMQKTAEENSDEAQAEDLGAAKNTPLGMAGSSALGIALHSIFEEIPFSYANYTLDQFLEDAFIEKKVTAILLRSFSKNELAGIKNNLKLMFYHTLNQPILALTGLQLKNILPTEKRHELEFLLYVSEKHQFDFSFFKGTLKTGYVTGFIDLIFLYNQKYYIIDWKTTSLGQSYADYKGEKLALAMNTKGYTLQYHIYLQALYRYLKQLNSAITYDDIGGVIYCFNRAMAANHDDDTALFYTKPSLEEFMALYELFK